MRNFRNEDNILTQIILKILTKTYIYIYIYM